MLLGSNLTKVQNTGRSSSVPGSEKGRCVVYFLLAFRSILLLLPSALCPGRLKLYGLHQWDPLPSGFQSGSVNGKHQQEKRPEDKWEQDIHSLSPSLWDHWNLATSFKQWHSSCLILLAGIEGSLRNDTFWLFHYEQRRGSKDTCRCTCG